MFHGKPRTFWVEDGSFKWTCWFAKSVGHEVLFCGQPHRHRHGRPPICFRSFWKPHHQARRRETKKKTITCCVMATLSQSSSDFNHGRRRHLNANLSNHHPFLGVCLIRFPSFHYPQFALKGMTPQKCNRCCCCQGVRMGQWLCRTFIYRHVETQETHATLGQLVSLGLSFFCFPFTTRHLINVPEICARLAVCRCLSWKPSWLGPFPDHNEWGKETCETTSTTTKISDKAVSLC